MNQRWSDNDAVAALQRVSDSLSALPALIPSRRLHTHDDPRAEAELPMTGLDAHEEFARLWLQRRDTALRRARRRPCPLCGSEQAATWFLTQDGYRYDICRDCGMIYIPEFLPLEEWDRYFADVPSAAERLRQQLERTITDDALEGQRARFGRYFDTLERHGGAARGSRLLDVGTLTGGSLVVAGERGLEGFGLEGLTEAVEFCRRHRPHLRITLGHAETLGNAVFAHPFDLVSLWETLEHTVDPRQALRGAHALLGPNGLVAITVPNASNLQLTMLREHCFFAYGGYQGIGHVNLFTAATLTRLLDECGFDVVHTESEFGTDWRQVVYYLQHRFDRIYCFRNLAAGTRYADRPEPDLNVILNWMSPALTAIENAWTAGPILFTIARRRP